MTRFDYFRCDECGQLLQNTEGVSNQLMYTLMANYDTDKGYKAHFCSQKCLSQYVENKVREHHDLPQIEDGRRFTECETLGEMEKNKEK